MLCYLKEWRADERAVFGREEETGPLDQGW